MKRMLKHEGIAGTIYRSLFVFAITVIAAAAGWMLGNFKGISGPLSDLALVVAAIGVPMVAGVFASEYPPGVEFVFVRMAGATFCRTGLPLLVVLLLNYANPEWIDRQILPIVFAYAGGFIASVLLSVFRLNATSSVTGEQG